MGQQDDESEAAAHDAQHDGPLSVSDEELPEDLQPGEDNPLAQPADDDVPDDVLVEDAGRQGLGEDSEDASVGGGAAPEASSAEASSESGSNDES